MSLKTHPEKKMFSTYSSQIQLLHFFVTADFYCSSWKQMKRLFAPIHSPSVSEAARLHHFLLGNGEMKMKREKTVPSQLADKVLSGTSNILTQLTSALWTSGNPAEKELDADIAKAAQQHDTGGNQGRAPSASQNANMLYILPEMQVRNCYEELHWPFAGTHINAQDASWPSVSKPK